MPTYLGDIFTLYESATLSATLDIGNVLGGVLIGFLTDLTFSRRTPLALVSIFLATAMQVCLILVNPAENKVLFFIYMFFFGILMGGAIAIISGISCADLVNDFKFKKFRQSLNNSVLMRGRWEQLLE